MAVVELSKMYEVRAHQVFATQNVLQVYHCQRSDPTATALTIAQAYADRIIPLLLPLQDPLISHTVVEVQNLGDPLDFATLVPSPNVGTRAGEAITSFVSMAIQFNRKRTDMKNGQKRYAAGVETDINHNFWLSAFVTSFETVRDTVLAAWFRDATPAIAECNYVVIKRICSTSPSPPCIGGYRLPVDDAELVFYNPTDGIVRNTVRSQVSRKRLV